MISREKVRGSMDKVSEFEINHDKVYIRKNVTRAETVDFKGWEYSEDEMSVSEYLEYIRKEELRNKLDLMQALAEVYEMNTVRN